MFPVNCVEALAELNNQPTSPVLPVCVNTYPKVPNEAPPVTVNLSVVNLPSMVASSTEDI